MLKTKKKTSLESIQEEMNNPHEYGDILPENFPLRPIPIPFFFGVSGLYEWKLKVLRPFPPTIPRPIPIPQSTGSENPKIDNDVEGIDNEDIDTSCEAEAFYPNFPWYVKSEELRIDVDGRYPQMTVSGTLFAGIRVRTHWIASLVRTGRNNWKGNIWYKDGSSVVFPYTTVNIKAIRSYYWNQRKVIVVFTGGGGRKRTIVYKFKSRYFHPVEFEFDNAKGAPCVTSVESTAHPNHPNGMTSETLTIENVYRRTGFNVTKSGNDGEIPLSAAGSDALWSDMEMHDAMQTYWSRFANKPQWSMWILFASLHEMGTGLGGIMFDDIGPNHRQGTAIFGDSFIANAPSGDSAPNEWVRRMRFWTACHEMGHAFNLAHSWQKELGTPWISLTNEPEARSFMNYPYYVSGGQSAFFSDFEYRFSDSELLFMRHAPSRYVQMGNADWFDHHGFEQANISLDPEYKLELRVNRKIPTYEFLEPVEVELKLKNLTTESKIFNREILKSGHDLIVILKKEGKPARQWAPFAKYCASPNSILIEPKKSIYHSLFVSVGINGWEIAEPGNYTIQIAMKNGEEEDIVSNPLTIKVVPPKTYDEEILAQDLFNQDVGRVLAMNGSRFLKTANNTLEEIANRLPGHRIAVHARMAVGNPMSRNYKFLDFEKTKKFILLKKDVKIANKELTDALITNVPEASETLGHINFKKYLDNFCGFLSHEGVTNKAALYQGEMYKEFKARKVLDSVLQQIQDTQKNYEDKK